MLVKFQPTVMDRQYLYPAMQILGELASESFTSTASLETERWGAEGHDAYLRDWWKPAGRSLENGTSS